MPYYRRQGHSPDETPFDVASPIGDVLEHPMRTLRQLLPFPGLADALPRMAARTAVDDIVAAASSPLEPRGASQAASQAVSQAASSIVTEAASVLDEEMARGVLAARDAQAPGSYRSDVDSVLRQLHDAVDGLARLFPELRGGTPNRSTGTVGSSGEAAMPHVKPASATRPGSRATMSMTLSNNEDRPVRLTPMVTELISCGGHRLPGALIEFTPQEVRLEPGASTNVGGHIVIPAGTPPGSYSGLLVVVGVDYLTALITVDVS
jgi:hypothetical protein